MGSWEESYAGRLRAAWGDGIMLVPSVRGVVLDANGGLLLIKRRDNGEWAIPAGSIELGESLYDSMVREVKEETGLKVLWATAVGIHSEPRFAMKNAYGSEYQLFVVNFRVDQWEGKLVTQTDETIDARFFQVMDLPRISAFHQEALEDVLNFDGEFLLK